MNLFSLKQGDVKRMPFRLAQNGAALAWAPASVKLKIAPAGGGSAKERSAVMTTNSDGYYDWTAGDYSDFGPGRYDVEIVVTKPGSVTPSGPETAPTSGRLQLVIEKSL